MSAEASQPRQRVVAVEGHPGLDEIHSSLGRMEKLMHSAAPSHQPLRPYGSTSPPQTTFNGGSSPGTFALEGSNGGRPGPRATVVKPSYLSSPSAKSTTTTAEHASHNGTTSANGADSFATSDIGPTDAFGNALLPRSALLRTILSEPAQQQPPGAKGKLVAHHYDPNVQPRVGPSRLHTDMAHKRASLAATTATPQQNNRTLAAGAARRRAMSVPDAVARGRRGSLADNQPFAASGRTPLPPSKQPKTTEARRLEAEMAECTFAPNAARRRSHSQGEVLSHNPRPGKSIFSRLYRQGTGHLSLATTYGTTVPAARPGARMITGAEQSLATKKSTVQPTAVRRKPAVPPGPTKRQQMGTTTNGEGGLATTASSLSQTNKRHNATYPAPAAAAGPSASSSQQPPARRVTRQLPEVERTTKIYDRLYSQAVQTTETSKRKATEDRMDRYENTAKSNVLRAIQRMEEAERERQLELMRAREDRLEMERKYRELHHQQLHKHIQSGLHHKRANGFCQETVASHQKAAAVQLKRDASREAVEDGMAGSTNKAAPSRAHTQSPPRPISTKPRGVVRASSPETTSPTQKRLQQERQDRRDRLAARQKDRERERHQELLERRDAERQKQEALAKEMQRKRAAQKAAIEAAKAKAVAKVLADREEHQQHGPNGQPVAAADDDEADDPNNATTTTVGGAAPRTDSPAPPLSRKDTVQPADKSFERSSDLLWHQLPTPGRQPPQRPEFVPSLALPRPASTTRTR